jgi:hypothetical protein
MLGGNKDGNRIIRSLHVVFVIIRCFQKVLANVGGNKDGNRIIRSLQVVFVIVRCFRRC